MTDIVATQAQLEAANQRIAELEAVILRWEIGKAAAGGSEDLDAVKVSVNTPDMSHEPCDLVKHVAEEVKSVTTESHQTSVDTAVIVSKIHLLAGIIGAVALPMFGFLAWLALQVWSHDVKIVELDYGMRNVVQQLRTAQPSTVAKSP